MSSTAQHRAAFQSSLQQVIESADYFLDSLPEDNERRKFALDELTNRVNSLTRASLSEALTSASLVETQPEAQPSGLDLDAPFNEAAVELQAGCLLIEAARAFDTRERAGLQRAINALKAEQAQAEGSRIDILRFDKDLLKPPEDAVDDQQALELFKSRADRTLDNIVTEAHEVIAKAFDKFKDKFSDFADSLGDLAKSFSASGQGAIRAGVEKVVSSLKTMAEFLNNDALKEAIEYLKEIGKKFDLDHMLAAAFGCADTKKTVAGLKLAPSINRETLKTVGARIAQLAARYVMLLQRARRALTAVAVVGGFLTLTGVAAHWAGLGVPIAYAVITVATILIGMSFARSGMRNAIASL